MENVGLINRKEILKNEKLIRSVDYDSCLHCGDQKERSKLLLDLEILHGDPNKLQPIPQRVLVTVKSRSPQVLTLFKTDNYSSDSIVKEQTSGTTLSTSDSSKRNYLRFRSTGVTNQSTFHPTGKLRSCQSCGLCQYFTSGTHTHDTKERWSQTTLTCSQLNILGISNLQCSVSQAKCYANTGLAIEMDSNKKESNLESGKKKNRKSDKATLIITNTSSDESVPDAGVINQLSKRIDTLEKRVLNQEIVFRNIEQPNSTKKEDETPTSICKNSYIEHYSHIPESSGFQRLPRQPSPSTSGRKTIDKTHNSEQYGREFTTYDGLTDTRRRRRQSASMPLNRCEALNVTPVLKSRNKHNTVRDYRLMDTVHYLAQGEFAPRNDGIKLTSSREAVLSDIIWEDVCRSHWPSARLTRRTVNGKRDRSTHRSDLQRQIDVLLQDRITHSEKRRRRHYRVMKMNQGNNNSKSFGKTGDVIVASNRSPNRYRNGSSTGCSGTRQTEPGTSSICRKSGFQVAPEYHGHRCERNSPGPSAEVPQKLHHESSLTNLKKSSSPSPAAALKCKDQANICSQFVQYGNSTASSDVDSSRLCPKLVVSKKDPIRRKPLRELRPSKEHYILLPTLVVKTSSHFGRQRKYNELYRALNTEKGNTSSALRPTRSPPPNQGESTSKKGTGQSKDIGFNVNIGNTTSDDSLHG